MNNGGRCGLERVSQSGGIVGFEKLDGSLLTLPNLRRMFLSMVISVVILG